jgi:hypothetical protein
MLVGKSRAKRPVGSSERERLSCQWAPGRIQVRCRDEERFRHKGVFICRRGPG